MPNQIDTGTLPNFVRKTWEERNAVGLNVSDLAKAKAAHGWTDVWIPPNSPVEKILQMRITNNACLDKLADRLSPENWPSLSPKMQAWLQDLVDVVRLVNNL